MIITIDGPTASGKSTVAQIVAKELSIYYLNSGFLYRALGYILNHESVNLDVISHLPDFEITKFIDKNIFNYNYDPINKISIIYKNQDLTKYLKTPEMDKVSSIISKYPNVRSALLNFQRSFSESNSLVIEGRDTGTVVFPEAEFKFFLTAHPEIRAQRWLLDQNRLGNNFSFQECLELITQRDERDIKRHNSPCVAAPDSFLIDNSEIDLETTAKNILKICRP